MLFLAILCTVIAFIMAVKWYGWHKRAYGTSGGPLKRREYVYAVASIVSSVLGIVCIIAMT